MPLSNHIKQQRLPNQHADVTPGSPLAVLALFTEIVRQRFRSDDLAWMWRETPTPDPDDTATRILIEPAFNSDSETRNYRPAIYVDKGPTTPQKVVVGNFAGQHIPSGLRGFFAISHIPMRIEVVTTRKGESAALADIVWFYLLAAREEIRVMFDLHDMGMPILGQTGPQETDRTQWSTHITFDIELNVRWSLQPISPILQEVVTRFRASNDTTLDVHLLKQYL